MRLESVYRVSTRNSIPRAADVDALRRELGMELPTGYREYVTSFGRGRLSYFLLVNTPNEIRNPPSYIGESDRKWLAQLAQWNKQDNRESIMTPEDIERAVVFARADSERPMWIATARLGPRLFEQVDGDIFEIRDGFFGLVERCTSGQHHEFPFFEPFNGRRRMRQFYVGPGIGRKGFVEAMGRRWGRENLLCSRNSEHPYPIYFMSAIEGQFDLHLDPNDPDYNRLPGDSFFVRARYDLDSEADLTAFAEPLLLPGGGPHEFIGESW
jgi:hypothetical protein